ncbi:hypothetical protein [Streptomyces bacillaris]|uniref:hypothetical protein n=1 Tax=Streptomyces bacillaris TaxID=68179 RepID=UPI0034611EFB
MARDARLVQTAVLDNADSEEPVECPTQPQELLLFRSDHLERTFWCGTWLGGCGGELTTRLCEDKVCHFAHKADPEGLDSPCRRKSSRTAGTGSADHLYIKAALTELMASQNTPGTTLIPQDPSGRIRLGAQVTAEPGGCLPLHFILDETALPALDQSTAGMVFGENVEPPPRILHEHGFVHRVRCVSDGAHRRTQIGTQGPDGSTDWRDLTADHVRLTEHGLSTEASAEIHRLRTHTVPIGSRPPRPPAAQDVPARPAPPVTEPPPEPDRGELARALRAALAENAGVTQLQRHFDRMEHVVHSGATLEETELLRQAHAELMRLRRGVGASAASAPPAPAPRKREAAKLSPLLSRPLARPRAVRPAKPSTLPVPGKEAGLSPHVLNAAAVAVRGALKKTAREQRTTSWTKLKEQLGSALPSMTADDRTKVLILVDQASASANQPLLSVLMAAGSPALARSYRQVALGLGLTLPDDDEALADIIEADTEHAHRYWKDR